MKRTVTLIVVLALIVVVIVLLESRKSSTSTPVIRGEYDIDPTTLIANSDERNTARRIGSKAEDYDVAKEISTPDAFINVDDVTVSEFIGKKVILVDFWTYSCINCQRTLPYLHSWHEKYADDGLVILGIHTPEFEFEKEYDNVLRAVEKFNVEYPVILDNDFSTWRAYNNRYWPRKYLIDIDGFIVYDHIGEGAYEETEEKIVELLNERSDVLGEQAIALDERNPENIDEVDFARIRTRETYLGYARMEFLTNLPGERCFDTVCTFVAPEVVRQGTYALDGLWKIEEERSVLTERGGSITIPFSASSVNLVAGGLHGTNEVRAEIYLDGEKITSSVAGNDVDENGVVTFTTNDLYNLVDLDGVYEEHVLEIRFLDSDIGAFAFTFG